MPLSKKPYRGTRDFFPPDKRVQELIFFKMKKIAESFGYEPYNGPLLEEVELYKAKSGEELINEQIYSFIDRGERHIAIRPEMTPTLARMVSNIHKEAPKPIRWYSIPNLMRYEKPQRGRLREHWQFNCDIFGAPDRNGEVEILQVAITLFNELGATQDHFEILLNDRSIIDCVFKEILEADQEQIYRLYKIIDKAKKIPKEALEKMVQEINLHSKTSQKFFQYLELKSFEELKDYLIQNNKEQVIKNFTHFWTLLKKANIDSYIGFDPTIVRGLDYYTGIVFEIFDKHPDNRRALCGGGAYANLLQIFNEEPLPGVGFGLGDVTLKDFLTVHNLLPKREKAEIDILATYQDSKAFENAMNIASKLRQKGLRVLFQFEPLKFKKVFSIAEKRGAQNVLLLGQQELEEKKFQIKNMKTKQQNNFEFDQIENAFQFVSQCSSEIK